MLQFSFAYFFCCVCGKYYVGIRYAKIIVFVFRLLCRRGSLVCSSETNRAADTLMSGRYALTAHLEITFKVKKTGTERFNIDNYSNVKF